MYGYLIFEIELHNVLNKVTSWKLLCSSICLLGDVNAKYFSLQHLTRILLYYISREYVS